MWIASAPDTRFRLRKLPHEDDGFVFRQRKANLNEYAEISAVLTLCNDFGIDLAKAAPAHILAIALLEPMFVYDELQQLAQHEQLQHQVFHSLCGSMLGGRLTFFRVKEVLLLPCQTPIQAIGVRRTKSFFFRLEDGQSDRLLEVLKNSASNLLPEWLSARVDEAGYAVRLPKAFAILCAHGHWKSFAVADMSRDTMFRGWTVAAVPDLWDRACFPQLRDGIDTLAEVRNVVEPAIAFDCAEDLRHVTSVLEHAIDALPAAEAADVLARLHSVTRSLQHHVFETRAAFRVGLQARVGNESYNIFYLLNCFMLSNLLHSDAALQEALVLACKVALPRHMSEAVLKLLNEEDRPVPSKSTISRFRLKLDVAWMLLTRERIGALLSARGFGGPCHGRLFTTGRA